MAQFFGALRVGLLLELWSASFFAGSLAVFLLLRDGILFGMCFFLGGGSKDFWSGMD